MFIGVMFLIAIGVCLTTTIVNILITLINVGLAGIGVKNLTEYHKDKSRDIAIEREMKKN